MNRRKDPLAGWRAELDAITQIFAVLEPLTDHARLRVIEAAATIHRDDVTASLARRKRAELGGKGSEPKSPVRRRKKPAGGSEPGEGGAR